MKAFDYVFGKQVQWALNRGVELQGSKRDRGRLAYTRTLKENLFEPLEPKVREHFEMADGSEIKESKESPAKMQAVHSSSALGVNIFQYWQKIGQVPAIAAACGFCRKGNNLSQEIVFEEKCRIDEKFSIPPNIDVVIYNSDRAKIRRFAIECKFSEAYTTRGHPGLKEKYLDLREIWQDMPQIHRLAKSLCPEDTEFRYLHAAQLIKHILGLRSGKLGKEGFKLLYLWYDVLGEEGAVHRKEVEDFSEVVRSDGVEFHALSYQELIVRLCEQYRSGHERYIQYISERYL